MQYTIYKHTSPSGKFYIGITSEGMWKRWLKHCRKVRFGSMSNFHKAIRKYGEDAWIHEIIYTFTTLIKKDAYQLEQYFIDAYKACTLGYNMDLGYGWNISGRRGKKNPMYGKISGNAHACSIAGITYSSISAASTTIGVNRNTIAKWICNKDNCFKLRERTV